MPRFPAPADALRLSIRTSLQLAEAGTVVWLSFMKAGLWWLPRPVAPPTADAPARARPKRVRG